MSASNVTLQRVQAQSWMLGFANLFEKENGEWWRTRTWLVHSVIWLMLINGILFAVLNAPVEASEVAEPPSGTLIFVLMGGLMTGLGIIVVMQGAVLDEKKSGTAAWVLSKPLSRTSFVFAKLAANALASLFVMVALQGCVAFILMSAFDTIPPGFLPFLAGLSLMALHLLFYLTLTFMLSTLFNERGPVLGIPIGLLFGAQFIMGLAPALGQIMPWLLVLPAGSDSSALADLVMQGHPLPTVAPIIATILWIALFIGVSLWRFEREEF